MCHRLVVVMLLAFVLGCSNQDSTSTVPMPGDAESSAGVASQVEDGATIESNIESGKQNAEQVLAAAISLAKAEDKRVFVHLGAPW